MKSWKKGEDKKEENGRRSEWLAGPLKVSPFSSFRLSPSSSSLYSPEVHEKLMGPHVTLDPREGRRREEEGDERQ